MKKFRITESDAKLLIFLLSVLLISGSYFFVYKKDMQQIKVMQQANSEKQNTVTTLLNMVPYEEQVRQKTAIIMEKTEEIISHFPSQVTTEKAITIIEKIEDMTGIQISEIGFTMNQPMELINPAAEEAVLTEEVPAQDDTENITNSTEDVGVESTSNSLSGYSSTMTLSYSASYEELKKAVTEIYKYSDRMCISGMAIGYDAATGNLQGNRTLTMYALEGTDQIYKDPNLVQTNKGSQNIFRTKKK